MQRSLLLSSDFLVYVFTCLKMRAMIFGRNRAEVRCGRVWRIELSMKFKDWVFGNRHESVRDPSTPQLQPHKTTTTHHPPYINEHWCGEWSTCSWPFPFPEL
jgi:hypothetical protein